VEYVKEILKTMGINPERIQMFHCSAAEGQRFQNEVTRVSNLIESIGNNPLKEVQAVIKAKEAAKTSKKK